MFEQVASVLFYVISRHNKVYSKNIYLYSSALEKSVVNRPKNREINKLKKLSLKMLKEEPVKDLLRMDIPETQLDKILETQYISSKDWALILYHFINYIKEPPLSEQQSEKLVKKLAPFFFLRVLSYFKELGQRGFQTSSTIINNEVMDLLSLDNVEKKYIMRRIQRRAYV